MLLHTNHCVSSRFGIIYALPLSENKLCPPPSPNTLKASKNVTRPRFCEVTQASLLFSAGGMPCRAVERVPH